MHQETAIGGTTDPVWHYGFDQCGTMGSINVIPWVRSIWYYGFDQCGTMGSINQCSIIVYVNIEFDTGAHTKASSLHVVSIAIFH